MKQVRFKDACKTFGFPLLCGFAGGGGFSLLLSWLPQLHTDTLDAIAIANTYIVFTTLIFVGFTVVLGIMGYLFTQQFAASKHAQVEEALDDLKEKIRSDEHKGIDFINALIDNSDVKQHLDDLLQLKIDDLIREKASELDATARSAEGKAQTAASFAGLDPRRRPGTVNGLRQNGSAGMAGGRYMRRNPNDIEGR